MKSFSRGILILAAVTVVPACDDNHPRDIKVGVTNTGGTDARIVIVAEHWNGDDTSLDAIVAAGSSSEFGVDERNLTRLKIRLYRTTDQFKIFDDFWDLDELEDLHWRVTVSVNP